MTDLVVAGFPWLVVVAALVLVVLLFRLDRGLGRGARGPGPGRTTPGDPPGLERTPWELRAIDQSLRAPAGSQSRSQLILTLNRLLEAGGEPFRLRPGDDNTRVESAVAILEHHLQLPPAGPSPHGSTDGGRPGSLPSEPI